MSCKEPVGCDRVFSEHVIAQQTFRIDECVAVGEFERSRNDIDQCMGEIPDLRVCPVTGPTRRPGPVDHFLDVKLFLYGESVPFEGKLLDSLVDFKSPIYDGQAIYRSRSGGGWEDEPAKAMLPIGICV